MSLLVLKRLGRGVQESTCQVAGTKESTALTMGMQVGSDFNSHFYNLRKELRNSRYY